MYFDIPILFLIFNRPDTTEQVFSKIRQIKPSRLYIASDGARNNKIGEDDVVSNLRAQVMSWVDWKCDVKTLFRDSNLGCKEAVSSAISWFFENEEQGIILEDDCLPSISFFSYCRMMLNNYKNDMRIWQVAGFRHQVKHFLPEKHENDYFFSKITSIWGWATWSNRWNLYEKNVESFQSLANESRTAINFSDSIYADKRLKKNIYSIIRGQNTWDHQWWWTVSFNNGLVIKPKMNLIENIGLNHELATNTRKGSINSYFIQQSYEIPTIDNHPEIIRPNYLYDFYFSKQYMSECNFLKKIIKKLLKITRRK